MRVSLSVCLVVCMSVCLCVCPPVLTFVRQPGTSVKADKESLFVSLYNNNNNLRLNSLWNGTVQKSFRLRRSLTAARLLASQWPQVTFIPNHSDLFPRTFRSRENYECRRLEYCQTLVRNDSVNSQESSPHHSAKGWNTAWISRKSFTSTIAIGRYSSEQYLCWNVVMQSLCKV